MDNSFSAHNLTAFVYDSSEDFKLPDKMERLNNLFNWANPTDSSESSDSNWPHSGVYSRGEIDTLCLILTSEE